MPVKKAAGPLLTHMDLIVARSLRARGGALERCGARRVGGARWVGEGGAVGRIGAGALGGQHKAGECW